MAAVIFTCLAKYVLLLFNDLDKAMYDYAVRLKLVPGSTGPQLDMHFVTSIAPSISSI